MEIRYQVAQILTQDIEHVRVELNFTTLSSINANATNRTRILQEFGLFQHITVTIIATFDRNSKFTYVSHAEVFQRKQ